MLRKSVFVVLLLTFISANTGMAFAQISGGFGFPCSEDLVDLVAICAAHIVCTKPPDPIDSFDIGARSFATCSNQPVDNFASIDARISGVQALATAQATALFYDRLIHREVRAGDCSGNTQLLSLFDDPQGCNPPPPPPPTGGSCTGGGRKTIIEGDTGGDGGSCDVSPVIVDTDGGGFQLTSAVDGITFDIRADGHPIRIAWTAANSQNAFLALDRNRDGIINNGAELFGNFTPQPASNQPNGFLALADFDKPENGGNGDGVIDDRDAVYSQLVLWIDENHDGISQPNELHKLSEFGIHSISLSYFESRRQDDFGNQFRYKARINPGQSRDRRDETLSGQLGRWADDVFLVTQK